MYTGQIIFSQLMDIVPKYDFRKIVDHHKEITVHKHSRAETNCFVCALDNSPFVTACET